MEVEMLMKYIVEEAFIIIPALWILGVFFKRIPNIPDWTIVWMMLGLGIAGAIGIIGFTVMAIIQGILISGVAVLGHQLVAQTKYQESGDINKHK